MIVPVRYSGCDSLSWLSTCDMDNIQVSSGFYISTQPDVELSYGGSLSLCLSLQCALGPHKLWVRQAAGLWHLFVWMHELRSALLTFI
eukprot:17904-Heterococcus_DN1.PRE.1